MTLRNIKCFSYVCFASEPISSVSLVSEPIASESIFFRNPFFRNQNVLESFFGILFRNPCFRNPFFSESILSIFLLEFIIFFSEFMFFGVHVCVFFFRNSYSAPGQTKMRTSEIGCVSLLCVNGEDFEFIFSEPLIWRFWFLGLVGRFTPPSNFSGWFVGGFWQLIAFGWSLGISTENVCGCVSRSSRIMTPGQRNPVSNSKEQQFYKFRLVSFSECMVPTLQGIIVGSILNNMFVSVKHTSKRSSQRCLCKNKRRRQTIRKTNKVLRRPPRVLKPSLTLRGMCWRPG